MQEHDDPDAGRPDRAAGPAVPPSPDGTDPAAQERALATARRRATGLLVAVAVAWVGAQLLGDGTAAGYLRAALEAGLVGGLADWFAVVALFRHPLGVPIPHTAVVPRSKDGLGQNLAAFVGDNFLEPDRVAERLTDPAHLDRLGTWLAAPATADRVAGEALRLGAALLDALDRQALVARVADGVRGRLLALPVARLAGEASEAAVLRGAHTVLVDGVLRGLHGAVRDNRALLRSELGRRSPPWVPPMVDDLVFERADEVVREFLDELAGAPAHPLRRALDEQLLRVTRRLQEEPELGERVEDAVGEVVTDDLVRRWVDAAVAELDGALAGGSPELRDLVAGAVRDLGEGLAVGGAHHARARDALGAVAPRLADLGQREVVGLVGQTVEGWDAEETSHRLELWLGRDLQFVRVNGTLVGALVGVVLHAVAGVLG